MISEEGGQTKDGCRVRALEGYPKLQEHWHASMAMMIFFLQS